MRRWMMMLLVLTVAGSASPALAWHRGPVCREPSVVDEMARQVRAGNYYASVDPRLVIEQPTLTPNVVHCTVCVEVAPYNNVRFGDRPVSRCLARAFDIQIVPHGFVVHGSR